MASKEINQDKLKALQLTLDKIEKNFGKDRKSTRLNSSHP